MTNTKRVHTPDKESFGRLMSAIEEYTDWKWMGGSSPTQGVFNEYHTSVEINNGFKISSRKYNRISVDEAIEYLKTTYGFTPHKGTVVTMEQKGNDIVVKITPPLLDGKTMTIDGVEYLLTKVD